MREYFLCFSKLSQNNAKVLTFNTLITKYIHWLTKPTTLAKCIVTNTWLCVPGKIGELIIGPQNLTFTFPNSENYSTQNPTHHTLQPSIKKQQLCFN